MFTPYDWQEGIGNRASYIEGKLAHGLPAVAVSLEEGILVFTHRRQARKIYEVYDRLVFAAVGQQSDIEGLRVAAVEFTHQEGYNRSEQDVTIQRVAAALSASLKRAFAEQLGDMRMAVGALGGKEGSTILTERNRVALEKLDEILKDGDRVVGVFYGAAHLPDMEERLLARGFVRDQTTWLEAWDLRDPKDSSKEKSADEEPKENAENASEEAAK